MGFHPIIAVTMGDPAGAGPEICLKACADFARTQHAPVVFGDARVLAKAGQEANLPMPCVAETLEAAATLSRLHGVAVWHIAALGNSWQPGVVSAATGDASYRFTAAIDAALADRWILSQQPRRYSS